uniref:Retrotransposon protein, putative, Ty1-copia subclass n=1 Tax=Oryza sativa subsp. japonica TaxID=39947 RepID=Q2R4M5_ORYSJ|nr:retrotransposon protein, putative, Ty1-copia subclass [Oryza sativa Japonica Group]
MRNLTKQTSAGFAVNEADKCVYYRHGGGEGVILCLYVDDILIFGTNLEVINEVKSFLSQNFDMKDLGVADVILNIKLIRGENGITLLQSHYVEKILNRFGYIDSKPSPTPYDPSLLLRKNKRITRNQLEYSQIIGSLMYLASATRPDISFAIKATSGYVFTLGGGAVSWRSCKQTILTRSTMEAELTALDTATVEAKWLRDLLMDLPIVEKPVPAILINCDNQTSILERTHLCKLDCWSQSMEILGESSRKLTKDLGV